MKPIKEAFTFLVVWVQLGLVVLAMWRFRIEDSYGLPRLLPLIFFGFLLHHLLPLRYRQTFFLILSILGIAILLPFPHSLILVTTGMCLVGICHLPIPFRVRVGLIILVAVALASVRAGWINNTAINDAGVLILPILGAMFMFRLAVYLYDLRHEKQPATISERLSYFFMLPNVCFLLFPVVDYQTYRRTYYNTDAHTIYQKGLLWMMRGLTHLVLYRFVYQYLTPVPSDVQNLTGVVQFTVTSFLIYLRISGQFHLIIGILCLFGFNLPETNQWYFLATGFNDYWRRINIYWKDFMVKMFYYPAFLPLRKRYGMASGVGLASVVVFLSTWFLHSYQWFWLRGSFPITLTDGLFWGFFAVMVIINSIKETRERKKEVKGLTFAGALNRSLKTVGFFALMSIFWSFWSTPTPGEWFSIVSNATQTSFGDLATLLGVLTVIVGLGVLMQFGSRTRVGSVGSNQQWFLPSPALYVTALASLLLFVSTPYGRLVWGGDTQRVIASLRQERLNARDREVVDRGYYEGLLDGGNYTSALWAAKTGQGYDPDEVVPIPDSRIADRRNDLLEYELKRSFVGEFKEAPFITNRWRMRGPEYDQAKPPSTYRVALVGASYEMAGGVNNDQTFPAVLEGMLNKNESNGPLARFEVLNFSVGGYSMVHKAMVAESIVTPFDPDLVVVTVYSTEESRLLTHLTGAVEGEVPIPYPELQEIINRSGAKPWMLGSQIRNSLQPHLYDVIEWSFRKLKADFQDASRLVVLFLPGTTDIEDNRAEPRLRLLWERAEKAGLKPVRVDNVFGDYEMSDVQLSLWDSHPNVLGHRLFAGRLYEVFRELDAFSFNNQNRRESRSSELRIAEDDRQPHDADGGKSLDWSGNVRTRFWSQRLFEYGLIVALKE